MPLYAGFDVGIKNLAFCVIDSALWRKYEEGESDDPGVLAWENLNVIGEPATCEGHIKSGKNRGELCGKAAKWKLKSRTADGQLEYYYYCGTHKVDGCEGYRPPKIKNLHMGNLKKIAFNQLDQHDIFERVSYLAIETQPRINQQMKMFGASIEAYFIIRHQIDYPDSLLRTIRSSPAKNKLRMYDGPAIPVGHIKDPYDRRKYLAQKHTEYFLREAPDVLDEKYFPSKKRDDLADAFLHCLWAVKQHKR